MKNRINRRDFLGVTASSLAGTATAMSAFSYSRINGANDRVNLAFLGCGARNRGHRNMVEMCQKEKNLGVIAVCDIWVHNRERAAADCKRRFGGDVKQVKYSEELLVMPELDGVMIATGDHQHAKLLAEVVKAGKDCYCEKPMAIDLEEAKLARTSVLGSKQVVQMGSQWVSDPYQIKVKEIIQSGKLGQITKIEQVWNDNGPRWHDPKDPDVAAIREQDTDWKRWLLGKPDTPFDPWKYFEFRIFRDYSGGITSQWLSHGIGLVHFYTGTAIPDSIVAHGGILAWPDIRQNPDTFQCLATYDAARFLYSYSSSYGNRFGDYTCIRGKEGTLYAQGGEGSPRWFFVPEQTREDPFDRFEGLAEMVKKGKAQLITVPGREGELPPTHQSDDSRPHLSNWIDCMRARNPKTNGHVETGFWHSVGTVMATRAYREGKKMFWDRKHEQIVEGPLGSA